MTEFLLLAAFGLGVGILIRPSLGIVLLGAGLAVLTKAGLAVPPTVIVGVSATLALFAWLLHVRRSRVVIGGTT